MTKKFWSTATAWIDRNDGRVVVAFVVSYAFLMFVIQGEVRVHWDNPGYVDPSVNYVTGHGFTSTCWYAQSGAAFWAGNVPLYQFLLIPWFKIFGVSYSAVLWLNFLYVAAGSLLIWRAMQKRSQTLMTSAARAIPNEMIGIFPVPRGRQSPASSRV